MAKRFTDTEKWKDPWFRKLKGKNQLFWLFVLDTCDHAGVWKDQLEDFEYFSGFKITENEINKTFSDRIIRINGESFFVPKFILFQYGKLSPDTNNAHKGVVNSLTYNRIDYPLEGAIKGLMRGYPAPQDKEQEKDICIKGTALEITPSEKKLSKSKRKPSTPMTKTSPLASLFKPDDEIQAWLIGEGSSEYVQKELLESFSHHVLAEEVKTAYQWQLEKKPRNAGLFLKKWLTNKNHNPIYNPEPKKTLSDELGDFFKTYAPKEEIIDAELT